MIYEQPRLIRFSDVVNWSTGQQDSAFSRCSGGAGADPDAYTICDAGSGQLGECIGGNGATDDCKNGPNTLGAHCTAGTGAEGSVLKCDTGGNYGLTCVSGAVVQ